MSDQADSWRIGTRPDIFSEEWKRRHESAYQSLKREIEDIIVNYDRVKDILDRRGIVGNVRTIYRAYVEELTKAKRSFSKVTLRTKAIAITRKYLSYGCDFDILSEIASALGLDVSEARIYPTVQKIDVETYLFVGSLIF